jgi:putative toxin-antitoxin system antitoxin component (TIGR02293 family)
MKGEIGELRILGKTGEKIDSIIIVDKYHRHFLLRDRRKASPIKKNKDGLGPAHDVLSFYEIEPVFSYLGLTQKEIAEILEVSPTTLSRWKKNGKEPFIGKLRSKFIWQIDEVIAKGVKLFGSEENFKVWLDAPNFALGGRKPVELLKDPYAVEKVDNAIEAMAWGNLM